MTQLTIRGLTKVLERKLRALAREQGISLNQAALRLMVKGAGLEAPGGRPDRVGDSLDWIMGTWSEAEARQFEAAVAVFEEIDEELWA